MLGWELVVSICILYVMVEVPYTLAFGIPEEQGWAGHPVCTHGGKIAFDVIFDLVLVLDIGMQMHSAFFVGNALNGQWEPVDKISDVCRAYFHCFSPWDRSLIRDLASYFPFTQISCLIWYRSLQDQANKSSSYMLWLTGWQVLHSLSLLRILKLWRL
jgi:hypothetical protein